MALSVYAWTEEYVVPGGAGANDGSSFANAWDITQVSASLAAGKRFNFAGDFTLAGSLSWATTGSSTNPIAFMGWDAAMSAPSTGFSDLPKFDGTASNFTIIPASSQMWKGIRLTRLSSLSAPGSDWMSFTLCEFDNFSSSVVTVDVDNNCVFNRVRSHDNAGIGIRGDIGLVVNMSEIYDNAGIGVSLDSNQSCNVSNSFIARNSGHGIYRPGDGSYLLNNTIDDNSTGIFLDSSGIEAVFAVANQITNNADSSNFAAASTGFFDYNNIWNNAADSGIVKFLDNAFSEDPQYVDEANNDYEIENTNLINLPIPLLGNSTIGAWQPGGGAAGGMIVHPGMSGGLRG